MKTFADHSYIYGAARTPIGKFNGALAAVSAPELGAVAIREALARSGVADERIGEVIMGNVVSAGIGQAPARQAAIKSGLPYKASAVTVNKVCGSGLKAVMLADNAIRLQQAEFVVAGGMESMSRAPFLLMDSRRAQKLGDKELIDALIHDGLWDSFESCHMGGIAEELARQGNYSREAQDRFALESYRRAREAMDGCSFAAEIVGVPVAAHGREVLVEKDEQPYANDLEKLPRLSPVFLKDGGTVTAGNASKINDGAAALVLGRSDETLKPLARIVGHAAHSEAPDRFPVAPVGAIKKLLAQWRVTVEDIDLFEINEAFAVTTLAVCDRLGLDMSKVNVRGGAVALGHPIGASGARILVTLLYALRARNLKKGVAAVCLGGGEAVALGVEMTGH
ncbi:MAG: thiolase family protein [Nitrospinales bacterium]